MVFYYRKWKIWIIYINTIMSTPNLFIIILELKLFLTISLRQLVKVLNDLLCGIPFKNTIMQLQNVAVQLKQRQLLVIIFSDNSVLIILFRPRSIFFIRHQLFYFFSNAAGFYYSNPLFFFFSPYCIFPQTTAVFCFYENNTEKGCFFISLYLNNIIPDNKNFLGKMFS